MNVFSKKSQTTGSTYVTLWHWPTTQCHKCPFSFTIFFCYFVHLWHCGWPMSPTTMSFKYYPQTILRKMVSQM